MVRRALLAALFAVLAACAAAPRPDGAPRSALAPGPVLLGAQLSPPLRAPLALAAYGGELYVADAGAGLVRLDPLAMRATPLLRRVFPPGTRLAADADGSVYLLDPVNRRVLHFARDGRALGELDADATVGRLVDFALDPAYGRVVALDALYRQLVAFRPAGRSFELLPLRAEPRFTLGAPSALAIGRDAIYAADPRCGCLARIARDGRVLATFAHQEVRQPGRIAVDDYGRLFVLDHGARALKVLQGERVSETFDFARLGVSEVSDFALGNGWLYIADAPGAQLRLFRVLAP